MLSHSIDWHLLDVVYNILNMQRYATSVAGQTCSGKAAKGGSHISASLKTFHCYDIGNSIIVIWHHWRDREVALGKLVLGKSTRCYSCHGLTVSCLYKKPIH